MDVAAFVTENAMRSLGALTNGSTRSSPGALGRSWSAQTLPKSWVSTPANGKAEQMVAFTLFGSTGIVAFLILALIVFALIYFARRAL